MYIVRQSYHTKVLFFDLRLRSLNRNILIIGLVLALAYFLGNFTERIILWFVLLILC